MDKLEELQRAGVVFRHDPEDGLGIEINMNDVFGWACGEGEEITEGDVATVHAIYFDAPLGTGYHAVVRWVCARRGYEPFDLWKEACGWPQPKVMKA